MSNVDLQIVREFFELNLFRVLTYWRQGQDLPYAGETGGQLFVENVRPGPATDLGLVLFAADLPAIHRAVVEVRPWHTERLYPSVIEASPSLGQFVADEALAPAQEVFGGAPFSRILAISALPATPEQRARSIQLLKGRGIGHVIEFSTVLQDMLQKVSVHGGATSCTLHLLRLLKRYQLVRYQQMEFPFPTDEAVDESAVETTAALDVEAESE